MLLACGIAPEVAQTAVRFTFDHQERGDVISVAEALAASVGAVRSGA